jgi:hypothetical protein
MKTIIAVVFVLTATLAQAAPGPVQSMRVPGIGSIPYQMLFEARSNHGETLDTFVLRISPQLRTFSDSTAFEACGVLAQNSSGFGIVVGTSQSHVACANFPSIVPEGMSPTSETLHSHGGTKSFFANKIDQKLMRKAVGDRGSLVSVHGQVLDQFSPDDFRGGAGYLAGPGGRVFHQEGLNTVREVVLN